MAKKYVNGYDKFRITLIDSSGIQTVYDFSTKYLALTEYHEKISIEHRDISGVIHKSPKYVDHEFRISYDAIEKDDLLKFRDIEDSEFQGKQILLTPHIDYLWRYFDVVIIDEKREIGLMAHFHGKDQTLNTGYQIAFKNKWPIHYTSIIDPDYLPIMSALTYEEF